MRPDRSPDLLDRRIVAEIPRLRAFLRRLAGREADDLVQEALARSLRSRASFDPAGSLRGWLLRTGFRAFLDHRRERARAPGSLGDAAAALPDPRGAGGPGRPSAAEVRDEVERLLAPLGATEREVLVSFHRDGRSVAEIARDLGLPSGTVKSHLHRARRKIAGRRARGEDRESER